MFIRIEWIKLNYSEQDLSSSWWTVLAPCSRALKMSSDQVPKEAKIVSLLLNSSGIQECEPKVVQQLMEFMF